ncbi:MAG: aconitase X catalytic domain-containing protein [Candidatus Thermoplasmatota archaeon]|nr:aconitase X catalytic domain-containing protein [Candidatus Thermoplasmatota archaeon]
MHLTREEDRTLEGEHGEALSFAMKILVNLGDLEGARGLIPITSAHVSGVSYHTAGEGLIKLLEELNRMKARVSVPSSLNPAGMDLRRWKDIGYPRDFAEKQLRIIELYRGMGINMTYSCIPYEITNAVPPIHFGDHISWGESNAIIYANSMIGARTNREGGISCLASGILGKTPEWGMHLDINRNPDIEVSVEGEMDPFHFDLLGAYIGNRFSSSIPFYRNISDNADHGSLKHLGAAMAAKGGISLFHIDGLTPEARKGSIELGNIDERITITTEELEDVKRELYPEPEGEIDTFVLGCPQFGTAEFLRLHEALRGKKLIEGKRILVYTARGLRDILPPGMLKDITSAGVEVYDDTCMVVTPLASLGFERVGTDSGKAAHYIPKMSGLETDLIPMELIVDRCT